MSLSDIVARFEALQLLAASPNSPFSHFGPRIFNEHPAVFPGTRKKLEILTKNLEDNSKICDNRFDNRLAGEKESLCGCDPRDGL